MNRSKTAYAAVVLVATLSIATAGNALGAEQRVITDDGREVLLRDDGSWEFLSNDRFADTADGRRVRLGEDGRWQYVGNAPMKSEDRVRTTRLDMELNSVVIEKHVRKVQKNRRVSTQTVFHVGIALSPMAKGRIDDIDATMIQVQDNEGNLYPVLSMEPDPAVVEPGSQTILAVRVDGSPLWWQKVESMQITFHPPLFDLQQPLTLSRDMEDIDEKEVDDF